MPKGARGTRAPFGRAERDALVVAAQDRDEPQELDVEPDDRDHDPEGTGPAVAGRDSPAYALLDLVEVEDQRVRGHHDHGEADHDAERTALQAEVAVGDAR